MEAGRELDALIAEEVMGFHKHHIHGYLHNAPSDEAWDATYPDALEYDYHWPGEEPHYSTNIADAWEVVERFVREGVVFIVKGDGLRPGDFNPKWTVLVDNQPRTDADTAPLAICLAALKAKGVTHE